MPLNVAVKAPTAVAALFDIKGVNGGTPAGYWNDLYGAMLSVWPYPLVEMTFQ